MLQLVTSGLYVHVGIINTGNNIAAFDLDGTLVRTIHGRFPKHDHDWAFLPNRIDILKAYHTAGYTIVIFTNQNYKGARIQLAMDRINHIINALNIQGLNPWVLAANMDNIYRKPNIGMWDVFIQYKHNIDKTTSMYVGDAAGRPQDHSNSDLLFAQNIGIPFYTPEKIFPNNEVIIPDTQTIFIFVGMPGSGKSTFYEEKLKPKGWVHANQDTLKTQSKMLSTIRTAISTGKSVAIDATNPNPDKRKEYIMIAAEYQIPTMIIYFVRDGYGWNKLRQHPVPDIAYNMYFKNLVEPTLKLDGVPVVEIF